MLDSWLEVELVGDTVLMIVEVVDVVVRDDVDALELEELLLAVDAVEEDVVALELEDLDAVEEDVVEEDVVALELEDLDAVEEDVVALELDDLDAVEEDVEEDEAEEDEVEVGERTMLEVKIDVPVELSTAQYALEIPLWMTKFVPRVSGASAVVLIESTVGLVHELPRSVDTEYHTV